MTPIEAALRNMLGPSVAVALSDPRETGAQPGTR